MARPEYSSSPGEVRQFAIVQVAITAVFLVLIFFMVGGTSADRPPLWLIGALLACVGVAAFFAERMWLYATPLSLEADPASNRLHAVNVYAGQTVRKLWICQAPVVISVLVGFLGNYAGWPVLLGGLPALGLLAFEVWPSIRNTSMTAAMLDARGAKSELVESFIYA